MYPWWQSTDALHDLSQWLRTERNYSLEDLQAVWDDPAAHDHLWTEYLGTLPYASATPLVLYAE